MTQRVWLFVIKTTEFSKNFYKSSNDVVKPFPHLLPHQLNLRPPAHCHHYHYTTHNGSSRCLIWWMLTWNQITRKWTEPQQTYICIYRYMRNKSVSLQAPLACSYISCQFHIFIFFSCLLSNNRCSKDFPIISEVTTRLACGQRHPTFCVQEETWMCHFQIISSVQLVLVCFWCVAIYLMKLSLMK